MFQFFDYQQAHFERLLGIFQNHKVAIDSSVTGSGKTVVSMMVGRHFIESNIISKVIVCAPPTLEFHWRSYFENPESWEFYSSCSLHKLKGENFMLIVDECHLFKNSVKRTDILKKIIKKATKVLMLSATPFDDPRQISNITELFMLDSQQGLSRQISRMEFEYSTSTTFEYLHIKQFEDEQKTYQQGFQAISCSSQVQPDGMEVTFRPQIFSKGLHKIHQSLIHGLIRYLKKCLETSETSKFVIVLYYKDTFDILVRELGQVLILNGEIPCDQRSEVVRKFQEDPEQRVCAISAEVGSVGIELDDKTGSCPRHMIVLPMSNSINFCQAIGRIQRTKTQSNSKVTVIQPMRRITYFKRQVEKKFKILEQFLEPPKWETSFEEHNPNCPGPETCSCLQ